MIPACLHCHLWGEIAFHARDSGRQEASTGTFIVDRDDVIATLTAMLSDAINVAPAFTHRTEAIDLIAVKLRALAVACPGHQPRTDIQLVTTQ